MRWSLRTTVSAGLFLCPLVATAQPEKILDVYAPGWSYSYAATEAQINALTGHGLRVINLDRVGSTQTYDVVSVANSGPYAVGGTAILYNVSSATLQSQITTNNLRIISIDALQTLGGVLYTAVLVPNSGASAAPGWVWLTNQTKAQLDAWVAANPTQRLIDIEPYVNLLGERRYAAVSIPNTGDNFIVWGYDIDVFSSSMNFALNQTARFPIDIELTGSDGGLLKFAYIYVELSSGTRKFWDSHKSSSIVSNDIAQMEGRLVFLNRHTHPTSGLPVFNYAIIDNTEPETRRILDLMDGSVPFSNGTRGFKAQRLGGDAHASFRASIPFEPASTIKILHAAAEMKRVHDGVDTLTQTVPYFDPCDPGACPETNSCFEIGSGFKTISHILGRMMKVSDNTATGFFRNRVGAANLNTFAVQQGMANTMINANIGCPPAPPHNSTSPDDLVTIYDNISNGSIFPTALRDTLFNDHMFSWPSAFADDPDAFARMKEIIDEEIALTNLSSNERADFLAAFRMARKSGSYDWGGLRWRSTAGWAYIPSRALLFGNIVDIPREYAFAMHYDSVYTGNFNQLTRHSYELLRLPVREALQAWDAVCVSPFVISHPQNTSAPQGQPASFSVAAGGTNMQRVYQWQRLLDGHWGGLTDVPGFYAGTTTPTLQVLTTSTFTQGQYRCLVMSYCGEAFSNAATLTIAAPCPGDTNGDGVVDFTDFSTVLSQYGMSGPGLSGDLNNDGVVDFTDFSIVLANYGTTC